MSPRLVPAAALAALLIAGCAGGPTDRDPVRVSVSVVPSPVEPGGSATLLWRFELADGWHLYWTGLNDSGYPPKVELDLPEGWVAGGLQWPTPERYVMPGDILDHVYHRELVLLQRIGVAAGAEPGEARATAAVGWLACRDACVPGTAEVAFRIPVADREGDTDDPALAAARAGLPQPLPEGLLDVRWEGPVLHLAAEGVRRMTFMPTGDCGALADLLRDGRGNPLALEFRTRQGTVGPVRGVLVLETTGGPDRSFLIDYPATVTAAAPPGGS